MNTSSNFSINRETDDSLNGISNGSTNNSSNGTSSNGTSKSSSSGSLSKCSKDNWIKLNVGGTLFQTTKSTLCRYPRSFFSILCQDDSMLKSDKDDNGAFLIDRDPLYFAPILNFLRHGKLILNTGITEEAIMEEAEFYNIPELVQLCKFQISKKHVKTQTVYRIFEYSSSGELAQMTSDISDGWKLKQLVIDRDPETFAHCRYLCIVSKKFVQPTRTVNPHIDSSDELNLDGLSKFMKSRLVHPCSGK